MVSYAAKDMDEAIAAVCLELGYSELREKQEEVVKHFLRGRHVFVSLSTGSGKSLCYSILPNLFDKLKRNTATDARSVVIVISPLIALMKDQEL